MKKRFIFGTIAIFFTRLHYRYEVQPYADRNRLDREAVREAAVNAHLRVFDTAWPHQDS
jgi:hypothetical protein